MAAEETIDLEELASQDEAPSSADFGELSRAAEAGPLASGSAGARQHAGPERSAKKAPKRRKKAAKKKAAGPLASGSAGARLNAGKRKKASRKRARKKASRKKKSAERTVAQAEVREPAPEPAENEAAAVVETCRDAVEESVPASADATLRSLPAGGRCSPATAGELRSTRALPVTREDAGHGRLSLVLLEAESETPAEVPTNAAPEPVPSEPADFGPPGETGSRAAEPEDDAEATPEEARALAPDPGEPFPEELSPEQAIAMLAEISGRSPQVGAVPKAAGRVRRPRPPGSVVMPSCRVIAFESAKVDSEMRVATTTVARLYGMIQADGLDLELGRVCQTPDELVEAWDSAPLGQTIILLVNLIGAEGFLEEFFSEVPEVTEAYWIVYETLRGEVTSAKHGFLAEQRAKRRAKAIGFGPRNVLDAARSGAEAVRWHVQWGFAGRFAARAG